MARSDVVKDERGGRALRWVCGAGEFPAGLKPGEDQATVALVLPQDPKGTPIISSTGRHDEYGNIDIRPVELSN